MKAGKHRGAGQTYSTPLQNTTQNRSTLNRVRITIKKPSGSRKSFALVLDDISLTRRSQTTIKDPTLDAINQDLIAGKIAIDHAFGLVLDLKETLLKKFNPTDKDTALNSQNAKLVKEIINETKTKDIKEISLISLEIEYNRLLKMLATASIYTITKQEIVALIRSSSFSLAVKNKLVCRSNILLKHAHRDIRLSTFRADHAPDVSHISKKDLPKLVAAVDHIEHLPDKKLVKAAINIMFFTGLREGELFGVIPIPLNNLNFLVGHS